MIAELSDKEYAMQRIQEVNAALADGMYVAARRMLHNMPACDVALLLESSPPKNRAIVWKLVDVDEHGEILEELSEEVQKSIIRHWSRRRCCRWPWSPTQHFPGHGSERPRVR